MLTLKTGNAGETKTLGEKIGRKLQGGEVLALIGELGAGKTCLTQGLALGLGVNPREYITSPSFTLINEYRGRVPIYHIDLFRLNNSEEAEALGCEEYFYGEGVTIIEWADKAENFFRGGEYLRIELTPLGKDQRRITLTPFGQRYRTLLEGMNLQFEKQSKTQKHNFKPQRHGGTKSSQRRK